MRGVITDVKYNKAVLLTENGEFLTIPSKNYMTGQRVEYRPAKRISLAYIAACFVFFMLISLSGYAYYTPVSYMSIEINPSIQLGINRFDRVISIEPLNEDAEQLLDTIHLKNKEIKQSVDEIMQASKSMGFLNDQNNHVQIDVVSNSNNLMERVSSYIEGYGDKSIDVSLAKANREELTISKQLHISIGKTKAIMEYTKVFGGEIKENAERLSAASVGEIKRTVQEKRANKKIENQTEKAERTDRLKDGETQENSRIKDNLTREEKEAAREQRGAAKGIEALPNRQEIRSEQDIRSEVKGIEALPNRQEVRGEKELKNEQEIGGEQELKGEAKGREAEPEIEENRAKGKEVEAEKDGNNSRTNVEKRSEKREENTLEKNENNSQNNKKNTN